MEKPGTKALQSICKGKNLDLFSCSHFLRSFHYSRRPADIIVSSAQAVTPVRSMRFEYDLVTDMFQPGILQYTGKISAFFVNYIRSRDRIESSAGHANCIKATDVKSRDEQHKSRYAASN